MKKLEIIIPNRHLDTVNEILKAAEVGGATYGKIEGRGRGKAKPISVGRGVMRYTPEFIPRLKVEVVVKDDKVDDIIHRILDKIGGDESTGGKIFVLDVPNAIDIGSREQGEAAL